MGREVETAFGAPYYHFHRADLADLLADALPPERLHVGPAGRPGGEGDASIARFENGATAEADVLVGADGIHSRVRHALFGPEKPRFTGCIAWRGWFRPSASRHLGIEVASHNWMGPDGHFVHYWVSARRFMNFVCVIEHGTWTQSWTDPGEVADVLARYDGWHPHRARPHRGVARDLRLGTARPQPLPRWSAAG